MNQIDKEYLEGLQEFINEIRVGTVARREQWTAGEILISKIRSPKRRIGISQDMPKLIASIQQHGILNHILVCRTPRTFQLIGGYRRVAACKKLGIKKIPALVVNVKNMAFNLAFHNWTARKWGEF